MSFVSSSIKQAVFLCSKFFQCLLCIFIALVRGFLVPLPCFFQVLLYPSAFRINYTEIILCIRMSLISRLAIPIISLYIIPGCTFSLAIHVAQCDLGIDVSFFR